MFRAGKCCQCMRRFGLVLSASGQNLPGNAAVAVSRCCPCETHLPCSLTQCLERGVPNRRINSFCSKSITRCCRHGNSISSCRSYGRTSFIISQPYSTAKLTHYEVLGLERDASAGEVRAAFLKKSKEYHPDINTKDPDNHKQFVLVNEAYSVLSRPLSRRDYDLSLSLSQNGARAYSKTGDNPFYHHPQGFYDKQFYSQQDSSRDDNDYKHRPYYGIPGLKKVSNSKIVAVCVIFTFIGIIIRFGLVRKSSETHRKSLDKRHARAHEIWVKAKKSAELYAPESRRYHRDDVSIKNSD